MDAITPRRPHARPCAPEEFLVAQVAAGDRLAYTRLATALTPSALALARRVLADRAHAEDAVQEALVRLWREARRYDPARGSFAAWWRRLLLNCALDGRRRLRAVSPIEAAAHIPDPAPGPENAASASALARRVEEAVAALPPRQRAALALFHGEGCSMAEIALALETSEKAVEGLLGRARSELRARLAPLAAHWKD
jgi:RNA polymerase sigma-70 factor (ECF subfamily)